MEEWYHFLKTQNMKPAYKHRKMTNGITLCILRTGLLCRDLLPCYGVRDIVPKRFYP